MADFSYEIKEQFGVISGEEEKWKKELNLISFGGKEAKYDIRPWVPEHEKMGKGVGLTKEELFRLGDLIEKIRKEEGE